MTVSESEDFYFPSILLFISSSFSLTLIDSLDTLVVLGAVDEFEDAVKVGRNFEKEELINCNFQKVIEEVRFDSDFVVSVFETNIRILGGLLSGLCHFS